MTWIGTAIPPPALGAPGASTGTSTGRRGGQTIESVSRHSGPSLILGSKEVEAHLPGIRLQENRAACSCVGADMTTFTTPRSQVESLYLAYLGRAGDAP